DAHAADVRADIYSLGCVLYEALAGQPPFPDANLVRQMVRHATERPRSLTYFNPDIPQCLLVVVDRMMAKDPAQRYPLPERAAAGSGNRPEASSPASSRHDPRFVSQLQEGAQGRSGHGRSRPKVSRLPVSAGRGGIRQLLVSC